MFREIERKYKKESKFNFFTRLIFYIYWLVVLSLWILGLTNSAWNAFIGVVITIIIIIITLWLVLKNNGIFPVNAKKINKLQLVRKYFDDQEYMIISDYITIFIIFFIDKSCPC